jgi:septal ring factor EnvC (AmiA/AmiB activator)
MSGDRIGIECGKYLHLAVSYFSPVLFQSAQEKYELQQEGDELDARIRKTEKEIEAMENTLKLINATNENYKRNLFAVDEESKTVIWLMFHGES